MYWFINSISKSVLGKLIKFLKIDRYLFRLVENTLAIRHYDLNFSIAKLIISREIKLFSKFGIRFCIFIIINIVISHFSNSLSY